MNEVRKRTGELGSTQLSELRLGEFSIRSWRFYEIKFYVHEIAAVELSKIYFLKNAKKTCKPNNRDLNV